MSKATPGLWTFEEQQHLAGLRSGKLYDGVEARVFAPFEVAGRKLVAECQNSVADAALIAAAPELRDALRYMVESMAKPFDHADRRASLERARAALQKAGE